MPGHQLVGAGIGTLCDYAIRPGRGDPGQTQEIIFRSLVQIDGRLAAEAFPNPFRDRLAVALDSLSGLGGLLTELIRSLVGRAGHARYKQRTDDHEAEPGGELESHGVSMPRTGIGLVRSP